MSKGIGKLDPFDLTGRRKKRAKKAAVDAEKQAAADQAAKDQAAADEAKAEDDAKAKALAADQAKTAARQAGIAGISDTLAKEGETAGRRRFLMGAK